MNRESNKYTIIFASVMVIIVALVLSLAHEALKDKQQLNVEADKMQQILRSIKIESSAKDAPSKFDEIMTDIYLIDADGNKIPDSKDDAFNLDLSKEQKKADSERRYSIFEAKLEGKTIYITTLLGKGLWGDVWGYLSIEEDGNTVYGADFSHAGETPGLGAEIATPYFCDQFIGKHLFKDGTFKSIAVVKPGKSTNDRDYVDGISGGTITGNGVQDMLFNSLEGYSNFFKKLQK
ncbi:NADH:ubiquinone reductase (Na(+)-transporting) subunit C [Dysgonomonas sp. 216]|uniref:NADH:ubiquinone reductase (Na(+)-transporting) subunit C n=1 Tax=Dysgonomonas sp. 216 TaxID=2302934 RepID=UPI0013D650E8|nr:NADH:ubiquinone reductase (Na(+)-transporting) subunit C [Dysgonomonas sp. 216]NDW17907.1 NADH:ubiquinone reductase (Na(+)-transporting) subunit C [Dysgonomonas sp. 216]